MGAMVMEDITIPNTEAIIKATVAILSLTIHLLKNTNTLKITKRINMNPSHIPNLHQHTLQKSPITTNLLNLMDINPLMEVIVNLMGTNHLLMEDTVNHTHQNLMVKPMVIKNLHMATPHLIMDTKDNQAMRAILPKNNSFSVM